MSVGRPKAGLGQNDPEAGVDQDDPEAVVDQDDPKAGVDQDAEEPIITGTGVESTPIEGAVA